MPSLSHPLVRRTTAVVAAASLALNVGCYSFAPIAASGARPGSEVRIAFDGQTPPTLAQSLGPRVAALEGRLVRSSDSALTVSVTSVTRVGGTEETWPGDEIVLPRSTIASAETRKASTRRSIIAAALIVAGSLAIGAAIKSGADLNRGGPRTSEPGRQ